MLRFDPEAPWDVGQLVIISDDKTGAASMREVIHIDRSDDGLTTEYQLAFVDGFEYHYIKPE